MRTQNAVITEILRGHPLLTSLSEAVPVPLIYVQQFWKHIQYVPAVGNHHFVSRVDHFTVTFGVNKLRELLAFPQANARPDMEGFEQFDDLETVLAFFLHLGYKAPLPKLSVFTNKYLPTIYNTLFTILNRCLTGKNSGIDSVTQPMALIFQGIVEDRYYDYAQLIFSDLVEMVTMTKRKKSMKYLPYVRSFSKLFSVL